MRVLDLDMDYFIIRKDLLKRIMENQYGLQKKFDNS